MFHLYICGLLKSVYIFIFVRDPEILHKSLVHRTSSPPPKTRPKPIYSYPNFFLTKMEVKFVTEFCKLVMYMTLETVIFPRKKHLGTWGKSKWYAMDNALLFNLMEIHSSEGLMCLCNALVGPCFFHRHF